MGGIMEWRQAIRHLVMKSRVSLILHQGFNKHSLISMFVTSGIFKNERRSRLLETGALLVVFALPSFAHAQVADASVIRTVGAVCGAGFSADIQGELDATIVRLFSGISADGTASIDVGQAVSLMEQFKEESGKQQVYKDYKNCVIQTISAIVGVHGENNEELVIENFIVPAPLAILEPGQRFTIAEGETKAIALSTRLLTATDIGRSFRFRYVDVVEGISIKDDWVYQGQAIPVSKTSCNLIVYDIRSEEKLASIIYHCS
jgi:hypothetical protein